MTLPEAPDQPNPNAGEIDVTPPPYVPQIRLYQDWLARERGLHFGSYRDFWRWSVTDLDAYWQSIWGFK